MKYEQVNYVGDKTQIRVFIEPGDPISTCEIYVGSTLVSYGISRKREMDVYIEFDGAKRAFASALRKKNTVTGSGIFPKEMKRELWDWFFKTSARLSREPSKKDEDRLMDREIDQIILNDFRERLVKEIDLMYSLEA